MPQAPARYRCPYCEDYDCASHNYCRVCGSHLSAGHPPRAEVKAPYLAYERFCGHCGKPLSKCSGRHVE